MNLDLALVLLMLAAAVVMFVADRPRMDAVALLMLVAMPFTGVITMNEALAGFSDASIVLIAALFVIGEGLVRTGVARRLGDWLDAKAGTSENRLLVLLMVAVGGLGSMMSSTAVVAIFIPVVLRIAQNRGMAPSQLMMPLSFAALISGMLTLIATAPNLVVNADPSRRRGVPASDAGDPLRNHCAAWAVHFQHRDSRADGAGRAGDRQGPWRLALSVCDDHRARSVHRFHDTHIVAGEHAGGWSRTIQLRRFRKSRSPVLNCGGDRQRIARATRLPVPLEQSYA